MKSGIASLLALFAVPFFWFDAPAHAAQPTREEMESAQTDGFGARRGKRRADEEWLEPNRMRREEFGRRETGGGGATPRSGVVTGAGGVPAGARSIGSGIVSAAGGPSGTVGASARPSGAGIVTGAGTAVAPAAAGVAKPGAGIVTGAGGPPGHANAHGRGRGSK